MKKNTIIFLLLLIPSLGMGCQRPNKKDNAKAENNLNHIGTVKTANDEKDFYAVLKLFKKELGSKNLAAITQLMNFPFYTSQQQLPNGKTGGLADPIGKQDYNSYKNAIYNNDVLKLVPKLNDENLSEIDNGTDEPYYLSIKKIVDKGSKLYEIYVQYPENNNQAENYFAFVFGRVNGKYKAISYYAKWPVK